jgi:hypothetical protein
VCLRYVGDYGKPQRKFLGDDPKNQSATFIEAALREVDVNIPFFKRLKTYGPRMILDVLEERVVLDASVAPTDKNQQDHQTGTSTNDQLVQQTASTSTAPVSTTPAANQVTPASDPAQQVLNQDLHVVLISNALGQVDAISKAAAADAKVITYDGQSGDIQTIVNDLKTLVDSTGHKIEQLELLSYGQHGILQLSENSLFSASTVSSNPIPWQTLGSLLTADAKIDLFGCNIGQGADGTSLVNTISSLTHATVWASDNTTGSGPNSDWVLETHSGESALGSVLDANVLNSLNVTLDNSDMTNPGFETGNFTGWTRSATATAAAAIVSSTPGTYGGIDVGPSPFAALGSLYMVRIDGDDASGGDQYYTSGTNVPKISQTFTYNTADHLVFAYDMVTSDGYNSSPDYTLWDDFGYKVSVTHAGTTTDIVNVLYHSGDVGFNTWQTLRDSGWQMVDIDLTAYAVAGDSVYVEFQCGNTHDASYDSWMFIDMQKTTPQPPANPLSTHGVLDVTVFENTGSASNTVRSLDNIFADSLYADSQLTFSVTGNTNPDLFSSVSIDPTTHQLTLGYALHAFGTAQITIHAVDPAAHALDYTFNVKVLPVDDDPTVPTSQADTTALGGPIPITLTGYDPDLHNVSQVSFALLTTPTHGTLSNPGAITMDSQGNYYQTYTYTPTDPNYIGDDPFTYKLATPSGTWNAFTSGTNLSSESNYVQAMELTDLNNDGYSELVTAVSDNTDGTGNSNNYYYANNSGTFAAQTQMGNDSRPTVSIAVGDLDGDGLPDVATLNGGTTLDRYYHYTGTGFTNGVDLNNSAIGGTGRPPIAVGDLDGDGANDILIAQSGAGSSALKLYTNGGAGTFDYGKTILSGITGTISALGLADLNNDGYLDMVVGRNALLTQVYQGHADGTFTLAATLPNTSSGTPVTYSLAVGDVNGDGLVDIVQGNYATNAAGVNKFYLNTGNFGFTEKSISTDQDRSATISLADVDHDGDLDVLVSNGYDGNTSYYNKCYLFDKGTLSYDSNEVNIGSSASRYFSSASGDANNDGYMDFVVGRWITSNGTTTNTLYTNQGLNNIDSNTGTMTIHHTNLLVNPKFDSNYNGWTLVEESLPATDGSHYVQDGTFAIVSGSTTTINPQSTVYDFMDGNFQEQMLDSPLTISGTAGNNVAFHTTNAPQHVWLEQVFYLPNWNTLQKMQITWDMEYWNHVGAWAPGMQDLALYVYDVNNTNPTPLWIATSPTDPTTQGTVATHVSVQLPSTLLGHNVALVFAANVLYGPMEFGVDNFSITATFGGTTAANPTPLPAVTLGSVFGPGGAAPLHNAAGELPSGMSAMMSAMSAAASGSSFDTFSTTSSLTAADTTMLLLKTIESSSVTPTTTTTSLDATATSTQTQNATTTSSPTTSYSAVALASPDPVQITPDPAPTTVTTTPDLLALALTPASATPPQAGLDDISGTAFASIDKGDFGHDYSFDLKTALVFDLDDVSLLHVLSLNAPVAINPMDLSESAILGEKLSAGRSVAVNLDSMRFSDILG